MAYGERLRWLGFYGLEKRRLRGSRYGEWELLFTNSPNTGTEKHSMKLGHYFKLEK